MKLASTLGRPMPSTREALLYTDDYWPHWLAERGIEIETKA